MTRSPSIGSLAMSQHLEALPRSWGEQMVLVRLLALALTVVLGGLLTSPVSTASLLTEQPASVRAPGKVIPPLFAWTEDATFSAPSLGGLPVGAPAVALGASATPWLFLLVNQGIDRGVAVKAIHRRAGTWGQVQTLGPAYLSEGDAQAFAGPRWFIAASSASGPALVWRSGANEITLAVESGGAWTYRPLAVRDGVLDYASAESWGDLWRRNGMTTLTLRSNDSSYRAAWRLADASGALAALSPPSIDPTGGSLIEQWNQRLWFDEEGRLHASYVETPSGTGQRPSTIVDAVLDEQSNTWGQRAVVSTGVIEAGLLRNVIVKGVAGLLWDAKDRVFGSTQQIEGAWKRDGGWDDFPAIEKDGIVGLPALDPTGGGCLYTTKGYALIDPQAAPVRLKSGRSSLARLGTARAYRFDGGYCLMPLPGAPVASPTWATQISTLRNPSLSGGGVATGDDAFFVARNESQVKAYVLSTSTPAVPGPVRNITVAVKKKGAKQVVLQVEWSAPDPAPYPRGEYRFRWTAGNRWSNWINTGSTQKTTISTVPGAAIRIEVRVENSVGTSPVSKVTFRS